MAVEASGICIPGLILLVLISVCPSGYSFTKDISIILSWDTSRPVLSISKNTNGLLRFISISLMR